MNTPTPITKNVGYERVQEYARRDAQNTSPTNRISRQNRGIFGGYDPKALEQHFLAKCEDLLKD